MTAFARRARAMLRGSLFVLLAAGLQSAATPPASAASPHYASVNSLDLARGVEHIPDATTRETALTWLASHLDGVERDQDSWASQLASKNGAMQNFVYRLDLTACQHVGCTPTGTVDRAVSDLPEDYYMHFSETTTLDFVSLSGEIVKTVTIPGCPEGAALSKACRVQLWMWNDARWAFNVNSAGFHDWQANRLVASLSAADKGIFLDEHGATLEQVWYWGRQTRLVSGGGVRELSGHRVGPSATALYMPMMTGWLTVLRAKAKAAGKYVMPNVATDTLSPFGTDQALAAGGVSMEFLHRPDFFDGAAQYSQFIGFVADMTAIGGVANLDGTLCYYGPSGFTAGNYGSSKARYWMWRLASYYMVRERAGSPGKAYFNPGLCTRNWRSDPLGFTKEWLPAYERGPGLPDADAVKLETGTYTDTTSSGSKSCPYAIFSREYSSGMVLVRPKDRWDCTNWGDASIVTVHLPKAMRLLKEDGTLAAASTVVTLRNAEAAILFDL